MPLSDTAIRNAKPGDKPQKLADGGGLYLLLNPNGSRWWRLKYRAGGKEKLLSLGTYPDTGLKDARDKRDAARKLLAAGVDPGEQRKAAKAAGEERAANSFEAIVREWHAKQSATWVELHASQGQGGPAGDYGDYYLYFATPEMGYRDGLPGVFSVEERRGGAAIGTPLERDGEHLARERGVRLDRLFGAVATRGEAVGEREDGDLHLDRADAREVVVPAGASEGLSVHEETKA